MLAYHRSWRHINAENQIVGRLATNIAAILMGKHKPIYDPACNLLPLAVCVLISSRLWGQCCSDEFKIFAPDGTESTGKSILSTFRKTRTFKSYSCTIDD